MTTSPSKEAGLCRFVASHSSRCSGVRTWASANAWCRGLGGRLPTIEEVYDDKATLGTECSYQAHWTWSSTMCGETGDDGVASYWVARGARVDFKNHHSATNQTHTVQDPGSCIPGLREPGSMFADADSKSLTGC